MTKTTPAAGLGPQSFRTPDRRAGTLQAAADHACAGGVLIGEGSLPSGAGNSARRSVFAGAVAGLIPGADGVARGALAGARGGGLSDDQIFRSVWYVSLLLMVVAAAVPLARGRRRWLRRAAWLVLIAGFLFALYGLFAWASA